MGSHRLPFRPTARPRSRAAHDKTLKLWDVASGRVLKSFEGHADAVTSVAFSPDGKTALSGEC